MSEALKQVASAPVEREANENPSLLTQIVDMMERRDRIAATRPQPIEIKTYDELERWAHMAAQSGMVPKDYIGKPHAIIIAVDMGAELGLKRMQALQNIAVINGRPSVWGDALWAMILAQPTLKGAREWIEGEGDERTAYCEIRRAGHEPVIQSFSVGQAKKAGLWKDTPKVKKRGRDGEYEVDSGPWYSYPDRMMQMRARGFASRDAYADVLKGFITAEEAKDIADAETITPVREPVKMTAPKAEPPKGLTEKSRQFIEATKNQLASMESPEEWMAMDEKTREYRGKLNASFPEAGADLEEAFEEARARLFPEPEQEAKAPETSAALQSVLDEISNLSQNEVQHLHKNAAFTAKLKRLTDDERAAFASAVNALPEV